MRFFPKNFDFFKLFEAQAQELREATTILKDLEDDSDIKKQARKMKEIEHRADNLTHDIFDTLNKTFITPIDREDITLLASGMDTIIDELERAIGRLCLYQINPIPLEIFQYCNLIEKIIQEVYGAIFHLRNPKKWPEVIKHCEIINLLENQGDDLNRHTLGKLLNQEENPILIIKLKEIYETLEAVSDRCEDVANVLETIIIKHT